MPAGDSQTFSPSVTWAQRKDLVYINIDVQDAKDPEIKVEKDSLHFKGKSNADQKTYETTLNFFDEINKDESKFAVRGRGIEFVLIKQNKDKDYWPRLLKENKKFHWLKIDFGKWKDEDDSDAEGEPGAPGGGGGGADFEDMMRQMGGLGGMGGMGGMPGMGGMGGMPGMGGMGGMPDFGDLDDEGPDSDDEDLPDLEDAKPDAKTPAADAKSEAKA